MKAHRDSNIRCSYLLQLAHSAKDPHLSQIYSNQCISISKKAQLKLSPTIKRSICKKCKALLIRNSSIRLLKEGTKEETLQIKCLKCQLIKNFVVGHNREYKLFSDSGEIKQI